MLHVLLSIVAASDSKIWGVDYDGFGAALTCDATDFPTNYDNLQMMGLKLNKNPTDEDSCRDACCKIGPDCEVYEWVAKSTGMQPGCWLGKESQPTTCQGIKSRGRGKVYPTPPPVAPPTPPPVGPYPVDDTQPLGMRWEGVGAISGGGATTKLLMDYPKDVVSDILDFLFKPNYGLDLDILKVEMGGDTDSTEGAEPSHMHAGPGDEDYNRGYEWWLMKEAKARKPSLKLYGLPWGWPGWLDPTATSSKQAKNAFANANVTANYTLAFLLGAKREHGLTLDYMGQWNERDAPAAYNDALRRVVSENAELGGATTVLNRLPHYPGTGTTADKTGCTQHAWNSTDGSNWVDEEGSIFDGRSARCLARCVNRGYVTGCHTAIFQWHLISSFYDYLPWSRCGVAVANEPWSGNYEITSPLWALAHTTQFASPGWRYTGHGAGVDMLGGGGSCVTRVSPDGSDFSIVVEKMTTKNSVCARGSNPDIPMSAENVTLVLKGGILAAAKAKGLHCWASNLTSGNDEGTNPPDSQLFYELAAPIIAADGSITILVEPEWIFTLTTIATGHKGVAPKPSAAKAPFPLPYTQSFDDEATSSPPAIWYVNFFSPSHYVERCFHSLFLSLILSLTGMIKWGRGKCSPRRETQRRRMATTSCDKSRPYGPRAGATVAADR